jgi:hypothetical protein
MLSGVKNPPAMACIMARFLGKLCDMPAPMRLAVQSSKVQRFKAEGGLS